MVAALALAPILEPPEGKSGILAPSVKTESGDRDEAFNLRLLEKILLDLPQHFVGPFLGCADRELDVGDKITLVFRGKERGGHSHVDQPDQHHNDGERNHRSESFVENRSDHALISICRSRKDPIEPAKKTAFLMLVSGGNRF